MSRRPALFRQSDLLRAMKAAQKAGEEWGVDILPDGRIRCVPAAAQDWKASANPATDEDELARFRAKHGYQ